MGLLSYLVTKVADTAEDGGAKEGGFLKCGTTGMQHECLLRPLLSQVFLSLQLKTPLNGTLYTRGIWFISGSPLGSDITPKLKNEQAWMEWAPL